MESLLKVCLKIKNDRKKSCADNYIVIENRTH